MADGWQMDGSRVAVEWKMSDSRMAAGYIAVVRSVMSILRNRYHLQDFMLYKVDILICYFHIYVCYFFIDIPVNDLMLIILA